MEGNTEIQPLILQDEVEGLLQNFSTSQKSALDKDELLAKLRTTRSALKAVYEVEEGTVELMAVIRFSRLEKKLLYISTAGRGCQTLKRQQMCDLKLACHRMWEILFLLHTFTVRT